MQTISPQDDSANTLGKNSLFLQFVLRGGDVLLEASLWPLREIMQATISNKCISKFVFLCFVLDYLLLI